LPEPTSNWAPRRNSIISAFGHGARKDASSSGSSHRMARWGIEFAPAVSFISLATAPIQPAATANAAVGTNSGCRQAHCPAIWPSVRSAIPLPIGTHRRAGFDRASKGRFSKTIRQSDEPGAARNRIVGAETRSISKKATFGRRRRAKVSRSSGDPLRRSVAGRWAPRRDIRDETRVSLLYFTQIVCFILTPRHDRSVRRTRRGKSRELSG
jgi:hypothetical protein